MKYIKQYWNVSANELRFCYPMGGGGEVEAPYRIFFEARHFKRMVRLARTMTMLELGCGNGRWAVVLAPLVKCYTAVDFSRPALEAARNSICEAGLTNVELREQSVLDFRGERDYDVVYFGGVTQYLQDSEIHRVLDQIAGCTKKDSVIVDRSTVNYKHREIREMEHYCSIYRTPAEIEHIFSQHGFQKTYQKRSYRFMRGARHLPCLERFIHWRSWNIPRLVRLTSPLSLYLIFGVSWAADVIRPIRWQGGDRSHDFFVFRRKPLQHA